VEYVGIVFEPFGTTLTFTLALTLPLTREMLTF